MYSRVWDQHFAQAVDTDAQKLLIPGSVLMERAGLAVADVVLRHHQSFEQILLLCGSGNNGGDGLVVARELHAQQLPFQIYMVTEIPAKYSESCRLQREILANLGVPVEIYQFGCLKRFAHQRVLIVDAILGLGFSHPMRDGPIQDALREARGIERRLVVAVDLPSGLAADCWNQECLLPADITVSFGGHKPCHLIEPSRKNCGSIVVSQPGFPELAMRRATAKVAPRLLNCEKGSITHPMSHLAPDAHKYDRGHVLVMGGSPGKFGAPILAGLAAARAGAGWITIAVGAGEVASAIETNYPELTFEDLSLDDWDKLESFVLGRKVRSIVFGPGWVEQQFDPDRLEKLAKLQANSQVRLIFDAGATHRLEALLGEIAFDGFRTIATPHPGEWTKMFTRLMPMNEMADLPPVQILCKKLGVATIYKGPTPIVFAPGCWNEAPQVVAFGSNVVAKAGAGDVLSGVLAAHAVHCPQIGEAAVSAIHQFYRAGELATISLGKHGVLPSNIIQNLGIAGA